jgi:hypothetical protein
MWPEIPGVPPERIVEVGMSSSVTDQSSLRDGVCGMWYVDCGVPMMRPDRADRTFTIGTPSLQASTVATCVPDGTDGR